MKCGVFLERDGILNLVTVAQNQQLSPLTWGEFQCNPDAVLPLQRLKVAGFVLIATTNQPGLSIGRLARRELDRMHSQLLRYFPLDDVLVCPHDAGSFCPCRKPSAGLLTEAAFKWHLDLDHSFVVSDKWQDAEAARQVGCMSLLVKSPWIGPGHHDFVLRNLAEVVDKVLQLHKPQPAPLRQPQAA